MSKFGSLSLMLHILFQPGEWVRKWWSKRIRPHLSKLPTGVGAIFIETHEDPNNAPSDGQNMVPLKEMKSLLKN